MVPSGLPEALNDPDISVLLHLSDTHFGTEEPHAVEALVALTEQERPDVVVASGDVTQRARAQEFEHAQRFFARLAARHTLVVPGNHDLALWDLPRRLLAPYAAFRSAFGDNLEPRLASPQMWIACLLSPRPWRHKDGALSRDQIVRTARWLQKAPPQALRVVVAHHPLAALRWHEVDDVLSGADRALEHWIEAGVHLVLGGHTHVPYAVPVRQPMHAPVSHTLWVVQAGSAVSGRLRGCAAHSVNLLRRSFGQGWRLERWDLAHGRREFVRRQWQEVRGELVAM